MSSSDLKQARDLALALSPADRAALVGDLIASLDGSGDPDAGAAWEADIEQRMDAIESGTAETVDADEVLRRIDARLRR